MRHHLTPETKIGEIRLLFNNPAYKQKKICLVEGESDLKLFGKIAHAHNLCYESINGRKDLITVMKGISRDYQDKLFAICDSDFNRLNQEDLSEYNILMTDYHDAEMLMLHSNAISSLIEEHISREIIEDAKTKLLEACLNTAYDIGLLRWYNENENAGLKFKGLNYSDFISVDYLSFELDINKLIDELFLRSKSIDQRITKEVLINKVNEYKALQSCTKQVCCGHDVTNLISIAINRTEISKIGNLSHLGVESDLRLAYNQNEFKRTSLFSELMAKWEVLGISSVAA